MSSNSLRRSRLRLRMGVRCICQSRTIQYRYAVTLILRAVWGLSALRGLCVIGLIRSMGIHNLGSFPNAKFTTNTTVIRLTSCHPSKTLLHPPTEPSKLKLRMRIMPLLRLSPLINPSPLPKPLLIPKHILQRLLNPNLQDVLRLFPDSLIEEAQVFVEEEI